MRRSKRCLFRAGYLAKESASTLLFGTDSRQADEWESFIWKEKKRKGFKHPLIGGCHHGEAVSGLTGSTASYMIGSGYVFVFLWLVLS